MEGANDAAEQERRLLAAKLVIFFAAAALWAAAAAWELRWLTWFAIAVLLLALGLRWIVPSDRS